MPRAVLSQITLNYAKLGAWDASALPVVLVHGLAASSAFWLHAAERLSEGYPVLLYDLRGHGRSSMSSGGYTPAQMATDLTELMDFLAMGRVVLAGHSFGGSVALLTALRCPDRVDRLVLADTRLRLFQPNVKPAAWPRWAERKTHLQQLGLTLDDDEPEAGVHLLIELARAEINAGDNKALPKWVYELFGRSQGRFTATRWLELVEKTSLLSDIKHEELLTVEALRELTVPLLGVYGENSPIAVSGRLLKETHPETTLRIVPEAGHFFPVVRPREFVEPVLDFLARPIPSSAQ